ncbi:hypothetical protein DL762_000735 [Monosporascus cannonballus]|uniref:Uncharacterized protein n=1 Tax=Monosporascus cannonballus TaxID=155416 RepID=A0ABY0HJJ2_9PEZI|nr:hypothetical protein DL762_000735 [Monosporascus cannonballus]
MATTFRELECAASDVIRTVKRMPDLGNVKLAIIGGLALWHYLPRGRTTDNINFITNIATSPSSLKKKLLQLPDSPFVQRAQILFYVSPGRGREIQVDISPEWLAPYLPEAARRVGNIRDGELPYVSVADLVIFKLDSSGLRSNAAKKRRDAADAAALLDEHAAANAKLELSPRKREMAQEALIDVVRYSDRSREWWETRLDLSGPERGEKEGNVFSSSPARLSPGADRLGRPHSASDPEGYVRCVFGGGADDASSAWFYERLDSTLIQRLGSLSLGSDSNNSSRRNSDRHPHEQHPGSRRRRLSLAQPSASPDASPTSAPTSSYMPSSLYRYFCNPKPSRHDDAHHHYHYGGGSSRNRSRSGSLNNSPKTTHRASSSLLRTLTGGSGSFDSGYDTDRDGERCYRYLEPAGSPREVPRGLQGDDDDDDDADTADYFYHAPRAAVGSFRPDGRTRSVTFSV